MEEQSNITFRVIKQGMMANANFTVLVNGKSVGKINFKKELTLPFQKGVQTVQFKVGFMTTKELKVNVDGNDKIIEWIYGNNREPYIVGEENNTNIKETNKQQNATIDEQNTLNNRTATTKTTPLKKALIIISVIIVGGIIGIGLSNNFDGTFTNTKKETLDQYAGSWALYSPYSSEAAISMTIDGKGNYTKTAQGGYTGKKLVYTGTYKIEENIITFYDSNGQIDSKFQIKSNTVLRNTDNLTEYRKVK